MTKEINDNAADAPAEAGRIQMPLEQFDIGQFRLGVPPEIFSRWVLPQWPGFYR
jgi:hypothetical protein